MPDLCGLCERSVWIRRADQAAPGQRRKTTAVLWPPKPNEFDTATSTCSRRAVLAM